MKIPVILLSCLCSSLAITIRYEATGKKENQDKLRDIRLVTIAADQSESLQKPTAVGRAEGDEFKPVHRVRENFKANNRQVPRIKSGEDNNRKRTIERMGTKTEPSHQQYMQKVANQLFMAQKHASLLSDYQKFILNQDQSVKNFVLGQSVQERNPKPFSRRTKQAGRALAVTPKYEPVTGATVPLQKIVVVTPKVQTPVPKKPQQQHYTDYSAQPAHVKYVTLAPQSLTHYAEPQEPPRKLTLLPYHSPQQQQQQYTYYDFGVTGKPHVEPVQIPSTPSLNLATFDEPQYHHHHEEHDDGVHHEDTKYEFMYKVKDHEKNSDFGHKESRTDKTTYGFYYVHLPDGRLETVRYWADKTGYHAKVQYKGEAKHPLHSDHTHNHY